MFLQNFHDDKIWEQTVITSIFKVKELINDYDVQSYFLVVLDGNHKEKVDALINEILPNVGAQTFICVIIKNHFT